MQKIKRFLAAALAMTTTFLFSSCMLSNRVVLEIDSAMREARRLEYEVVAQPQMTVAQNETGMYEVSVCFSIKNTSDANCRVLEWVLSFYDAAGYLIGSHKGYDNVTYYDDPPSALIERGETKELVLENFELAYEPALVEFWDIGLYVSV